MAAPTIIPKSTYYDGPVTESERAKSMGGVPDFTVYGPDELRLSAHPTIPFALVVSRGRASAFGVTAYVEGANQSNLTVQCDTNSTGTRWDIIVLRYDWRPGSGGPTDIRAINAGGKQIPTNLEKTPGSIVDQPTWLVRWTGNASAPAEYVDLRCFAANGGMSANDRLALGYLGKPGAAVRIGDWSWEYALIGNRNYGWRANHVGDSGWVEIPTAPSGFFPLKGNGWSGMHFRYANGWAMINGAVTRGAPWGHDALVATLSPDLTPAVKIQGTGCQVTPPRDGFGGNGLVVLPAGSTSTSFSAMWPLTAPS